MLVEKGAPLAACSPVRMGRAGRVFSCTACFLCSLPRTHRGDSDNRPRSALYSNFPIAAHVFDNLQELAAAYAVAIGGILRTCLSS